MTDQIKPRAPHLPHHKLVAYQVSVELLLAVKAANIRDAKLREEAVRAAKGTCLNCAEAAGRVSRADKARVFAIARGEAVEAVAAVEIAAHAGDATQEAAYRCVVLGDRLVALLTGLIRR
ncbi:MAG: four helix bundle protein [Myxococcales bacterium]|nr:four helix bundle protein [Myxococcales bacterium]